jgi:uncharacterized protein
MFEIKNVQGQIVDVDSKSNVVKGYASVFNYKDSDNDIILPGAYAKTLKESGDRVLHLYQHDPMRPLSSVRSGNLRLKEDEKGLSFESTITPTTWGMDVIKLIQDGVLTENSVGFRTVKSADRKGHRELQELKLFEISSVSWGANDKALNTKGIYSEDFLQTRLDSVTKAIRNGKYTDETFNQLEIYLLQLNQQILESKSTKADDHTSLQPDEEALAEIRQINKLFR